MKSLDCLTKDSIALLHRNQLLRPLISAELLKDELSSILIENEVKDKLINNFSEKLGLTDKKSFNLWLTENSISEDEFEYLALNEAKIKKFCKEKLDHKVKQHFLKRKSQLDIVSYSLIRVSSLYIARELCLRIVNQEGEFGDLAASFSEGMEKKTRGVLGPCSLEKAHPQLIKILSSSVPGEIKGPIKIENYFLILRLESYNSAQLDDFMRDKMSLELFDDLIENRVKENYLKVLNSQSSNEVIGEQI